jgi:hypothetical protein
MTPPVMRILIHSGMPKCGSTSLQHAFYQNREFFREVHRISFGEPDIIFGNHYKLSTCIQSGSKLSVEQYLETQMTSALREGASTLVMSCEDLFLLPGEYGNEFGDFEMLLHSFGVENVQYVILTRNFHSWANSYLRHLFFNGINVFGDLPRFYELPSFVSRCLRAFLTSRFRCSVLSVDAAESELLMTRLLRETGFNGESIKTGNLNIGSGRYLFSTSLSAPLVALVSFNEGVHPNSPVPTQIVADFEQSLAKASNNAELAAFIDRYERLLGENIFQYITKAIKSTSAEDLEILKRSYML